MASAIRERQSACPKSLISAPKTTQGRSREWGWAGGEALSAPTCRALLLTTFRPLASPGRRHCQQMGLKLVPQLHYMQCGTGRCWCRGRAGTGRSWIWGLCKLPTDLSLSFVILNSLTPRRLTPNISIDLRRKCYRFHSGQIGGRSWLPNYDRRHICPAHKVIVCHFPR